MTNRTDVHSPKNLVTEDYEYLYAWDSRQPGCLVGIAQSEAWREWHSKGPVHEDVSSSQCTHCGAHLRYVALLRYVPTGQYLYVGETCLDNRFGRATSDFQKLRKQAALDAKEQRIVKAWAEYKATHEADWDALAASTNPFVIDVLSKGRRYGNLSDRQLDAIVRSIAKDLEPKPERAPKVPVPEGRQTITGRIVKVAVQRNDFGSRYVITVVVTTPAGEFAVWGTHPSAIQKAEPGDTVTFVATVERSDRDESFGFFKRPIKAAILAREVVA